MEEQRQRQEDEARRAQAKDATVEKKPETIKEAPNEEAMLKRALEMSMEAGEESTTTPTPSSETATTTSSTGGNMPDFARMSEEEQIAFAMQMSMQDQRKFHIICSGSRLLSTNFIIIKAMTPILFRTPNIN